MSFTQGTFRKMDLRFRIVRLAGSVVGRSLAGARRICAIDGHRAASWGIAPRWIDREPGRHILRRTGRGSRARFPRCSRRAPMRVLPRLLLPKLPNGSTPERRARRAYRLSPVLARFAGWCREPPSCRLRPCPNDLRKQTAAGKPRQGLTGCTSRPRRRPSDCA